MHFVFICNQNLTTPRSCKKTKFPFSLEILVQKFSLFYTGLLWTMAVYIKNNKLRIEVSLDLLNFSSKQINVFFSKLLCATSKNLLMLTDCSTKSFSSQLQQPTFSSSFTYVWPFCGHQALKSKAETMIF